MVSATTIKPGHTVRDKHLKLTWVVVAYDGLGAVQIERNGVRVSASLRDLEVFETRRRIRD